jgi:hypothetical protein
MDSLATLCCYFPICKITICVSIRFIPPELLIIGCICANMTL